MARTTNTMHLQAIAVLLTAGWAHVQAAALPGPAFDNGPLVLLHTRIIDSGRLEYWGVPPADTTALSDFDWDAGWGNTTEFVPAAAAGPGPAPAASRCGANRGHCSNANLGSRQACDILIHALRSDPWGVIALPSYGIFSITHEGMCGIGWGGQIPGLLNGYLVPAAAMTLEGCTTDSRYLSGYAVDVNLKGHCTVQCLSKVSVASIT